MDKIDILVEIYKIADEFPKLISLRDSWEEGCLSHREMVERTLVITKTIAKKCEEVLDGK
jgi:hypothetical protein